MLSKYKSNITAPILVAIAYLFLLLSKMIDTGRLSGDNEYIGVIVLQLIIFLLPAVIYSKLKGEGYTARLRLRLIGAQQMLAAVLGALTLICGSLLLGILFKGGTATDDFSLYNTFTASSNGTAEAAFYATLAYAVLPALCEEFFFRAVLSAEYEEHGIGTALVMSSLFFGMTHFNFGQLVLYFFSGAVLFAVMYATRSLLGSVLVHFIYNMYGLFGQGFLLEVYRTTGSTELFLLLLAAAFILFAALLCGEIARLYRRYSSRGLSSDYAEGKAGRNKGKQMRRKNESSEKSSFAEALLAPPCLAIYLIFFFVSIFS